MNYTILVDIDDTTLKHKPEWLRRYNRDYDDNLCPEDILTWNMDKYVKPECGLRIYNYLKDKNLYEHMNPYPDALDGINRIRSLGHRVIFVSAHFDTSKVECLHRHGFLVEFPYNDGRWETATDAALINDKSVIKGDFLIDDRIENVEKYGSGFLFDQPWNRQSDIYRFSNWNDIASYFEFERNWRDGKININ